MYIVGIYLKDHFYIRLKQKKADSLSLVFSLEEFISHVNNIV